MTGNRRRQDSTETLWVLLQTTYTWFECDTVLISNSLRPLLIAQKFKELILSQFFLLKVSAGVLEVKKQPTIRRWSQQGFMSMGCKLGSTMEYFHYSNPLPASKKKKKLSLSPIPPLLTLQLDLSPVTVANLGWQRACGERRLERKEGGGKNCTSPKNFLWNLQEQCRSREVLFLGSLECVAGKCGCYMCPGFER